MIRKYSAISDSTRLKPFTLKSAHGLTVGRLRLEPAWPPVCPRPEAAGNGCRGRAENRLRFERHQPRLGNVGVTGKGASDGRGKCAKSPSQNRKELDVSGEQRYGQISVGIQTGSPAARRSRAALSSALLNPKALPIVSAKLSWIRGRTPAGQPMRNLRRWCPRTESDRARAEIRVVGDRIDEPLQVSLTGSRSREASLMK
jgi:hypothetical protein